ncbi:hypothetical protein KBZ14_15045 [Synechococcus sp. HJ21-Hayes]|uniref:hypothetical protein n=1 Tax=Synechococcus sp. HJ21-Hayes TaxID=2823736 RepID=UPI0020CB9D25|nr:hypothetical protein [Synechococcus sp. HJ21-Hayes]MCP9854174.1 hypothetical protein [Synechococcus sp. HJ21-Hayes]
MQPKGALFIQHYAHESLRDIEGMLSRAIYRHRQIKKTTKLQPTLTGAPVRRHKSAENFRLAAQAIQQGTNFRLGTGDGAMAQAEQSIEAYLQDADLADLPRSEVGLTTVTEIALERRALNPE